MREWGPGSSPPAKEEGFTDTAVCRLNAFLCIWVQTSVVLVTNFCFVKAKRNKGNTQLKEDLYQLSQPLCETYKIKTVSSWLNPIHIKSLSFSVRLKNTAEKIKNAGHFTCATLTARHTHAYSSPDIRTDGIIDR